jgi:hypothetical protein
MRAYEFIIEASYDQMIMTMRAEYPDQSQIINDNLKWAKANLKKEDRVVWFMKIVRDQLSGNNASSGDYQFKSFEQLQNDILHFYGYQSDQIDRYQYKNQTISQVLDDLKKLEDEFQKNQDKTKPITPQQGDYKLIEFNDGMAWWFVNRAFCSEEGRSGKHCGNVVGKEKTDQRILSLRTNQGHVVLTFVLEPDGKLGEMKAKGNQKPMEKYHSHIMALLMNDKVTGIQGAGYLPEMNFSLFDLNDNDLKIIDQKKPNYIIDQIKAEPIEILKAPEWIRQNKTYRDTAIKSLSGLDQLIDNNGNISTDNKSWENAININEDLIIYAPDTLDDFKNRVVDLLANDPSLLLKSPKSIRNDFEILKNSIHKNLELLQYIIPTTPRYHELCKIAVNKNSISLQFVPEESRTPELCELAVNQNGTSLQFVPEHLRTLKLCELAVKYNGRMFQVVPEQLRTPELCKIAVTDSGGMLKFVPKQLITPELCKIAVNENYWVLVDVPEQLRTPELCTLAVNEDGKMLKHVPEQLRTPELCRLAVNEDGRMLEFVPEELRSPELCITAVLDFSDAFHYVPEKYRTLEIYKIAIKYNGEILELVPEELKTPELCRLAVNNDGMALQHVPKPLRSMELCKIAMEHDFDALRFVPDNLKHYFE